MWHAAVFQCWSQGHELILMHIGTRGPWGRGMRWSTLGRSRSLEAEKSHKNLFWRGFSETVPRTLTKPGWHVRHDSLLRITLEGQTQGKKAYGRSRTMLLDWLLKTEEGNISYEELKMSAQDRSRWSQWRWKPAIWQSTTERKRQAHGKDALCYNNADAEWFGSRSGAAFSPLRRAAFLVSSLFPSQ